MARAIVEEAGEYRGYSYMVIMTTMGHRCGYVGFTKEQNPDIYKADYEGICVDCHGGLTYSGEKPLGTDDKWWIGFDCAHYGDAPDYDTAKMLFSKDKEILDQLCIFETFGPLSDYDTIRTKDYCVVQCIEMIDQLAEGEYYV